MSELTLRLRTAIVSLLMLVGIGTVGYRVLDGIPWFDGFYMTMITLTTIGYGEPAGLTIKGRVLTVFLIVAGVAVAGYTFSVLTQAILQGEFLSALEKRRMHKDIENLENHFIICGWGRVGMRVARELAQEKAPFVIVEREEVKATRAAREGLLVLLGDATTEEVLERARITHARGLVCALPTDPDNVYVTLTARDISKTLYIVSRVNDPAAIPKMQKAGADRVVSPMATGAHQIAQALLRPTVLDFIEIATKTEGMDLLIEEVRIPENSPLAGKTLRQSEIRARFDVIVMLIKRDDGQLLFNPTGETDIRVGDNVIAVGKRASVDEMARLATPPDGLRRA